MPSQILHDFDITITRSGDHYLAALRTPDGQRLQTSFEMPLDEFQLKYYVSVITGGPQPVRRSTRDSAAEVTKALGASLFGSLFSDNARQSLDRAIMGIGDTREHGLRIRIDLSGAPELATLPWEYLYYADRGLFLALDPDLSIVRYIQMPDPPRAMHVQPPLRILAMASSPANLESLDTVRERTLLESSLDRLVEARMVQVDWLTENTLAAITRALDHHKYDIFHFLGHGTLSDHTGELTGYLMFEDEARQAVAVPAEALGTALRRSVRLALINACEGAFGDTQHPANGVASSLLLHGIPAVIAMQFQITDQVAAQFAGEFYSGIAIGLPVDAAVTSARRNVWARLHNNPEWGTPVLYMRSPNGALFDLGDLTDTDEQTSALRREVVESTMSNLNVDFDQLKRLVSSGLGGVSRQLPNWFKSAWSNSTASTLDLPVDEMYAQAVHLSEQERWREANRLFNQINDRAPGYRDIGSRWQYARQQEHVSDLYRRMVKAFAEGKWNKVVEAGESILRVTTSYKDSLNLYNQACTVLGRPIRPQALPSATLLEHAPDAMPGREGPPETLPTAHTAAQAHKPTEHPPSLPS